MFLPPDQFAIVSPNIYRSCTIAPANYDYIKTLSLAFIILLSPESPSKSLLSFLESSKIQLFHLNNSHSADSWHPLSEESVKEGLELLLGKAGPALVMCSSGIHETGTFIGIYRKYQNWNLVSILMEFRMFAGNRARYLNELFIELFDLDLLSIKGF